MLYKSVSSELLICAVTESQCLLINLEPFLTRAWTQEIDIYVLQKVQGLVQMVICIILNMYIVC